MPMHWFNHCLIGCMKYKCSLQSNEDNTKMTEKTDMIDVRVHLRSVDPMKLKLLIEFFSREQC